MTGDSANRAKPAAAGSRGRATEPIPAGDGASRLQALLDATSEPVLLAEPLRSADGAIIDFVCVVANEAAGICSGLSRDGVIGARLLATMVRSTEAGLLARLCRVLESGEPAVLSDIACSPEIPGGEGRQYEVRIARCGEGLSCVWRDTTDRRVAAALAASEERFRLITDNVSDTLWLMDLDTGRLAYVTPSIERQTGFTPQQAMARGVKEWLTPECGVRMRNAVAAVMAAEIRGGGGRPFVIEVDQVLKDGSILPTETTLRLLPAGDGCPRLLLGVGRDISERRAAAEALRRSEEHYRLLAEHSSEVVFVTGLDRRAVWIAPTVARTLGWSAEELLGTCVHDLMHPEDRRATDGIRMGVYSGPHATVAEGSLLVRMRTKSGQYRWMSGAGAAMTDQDG